jgi:hypothetical protein
MPWVSVPSELKIGEMVCNHCSQSSLVTSSSSICTKIDVRFHSGCISPHVLLYHVNHMVVQMMSIAVEIVLLVPKLLVHVYFHNIYADML